MLVLEGTPQVKRTSWSTGLSVTADGVGVVAHAGSVASRLLADRIGLTGALSTAMARRGFVPGHDRGRVLVDVAVMLADGGEAISDIDVLRHQSGVLGPVASPPTVWRTPDEVTPARLRKIATARARVRRHVWAQLPRGVPASKVAGTDPADVIVLDVDATVVIAHSEKENAAATFKRTFGYHPIGVWCDNTSEFLAAKLRAGNAGSNTTSDHIEVLTDAIAQVPTAHRRKLLIRSDGAGSSHGLLDWLTEQGKVRGRSVEYSIGFSVTEKIREAITLVPTKVWTPATNADGGVREGGDVAELTGLLDPDMLAKWPAGMRVIVRRERPHPGAQLSLFEETDGWRYQAFVTNTPKQPGVQLAFLEARHRAHARVEDRIRHAKDSGLRRFPSREFAINQTWLTLVQIAADLTAWTRLLAMTGDAQPPAACEPKALRYRFLHVPARLTHGARRRRLQVPKTRPRAAAIVAVFANIAAIPPPT
ncbi:IS1380 family transposase [Janibacter limosus]|uniref:IS1380 family transposase n=1 Tax=Janibacter limosus TaxID=53458 RepID=A0AC61U8M4_9MICO|nr:IS1380 family transposase [Janibacter limosus]UUZ46410.1 IS1380 family transposase [Janibacter limosus]